MRSSSVGLALAASLAFAGSRPVHAEPLGLIPEPKEVQPRDGAPFLVGPSTRIIVGTWHASEDRLAAETLAEEIREAVGSAPTIAEGRGVPAGGSIIYLARLTDDQALRRALGEDGASLGDEGYLLSVERGRILVGGADAAGLFYGAQTLRQLLRGQGSKGFGAAPLRVRDWPTLRWRGVHDDLSRGPIPTLDYMKRQIRTLASFKINLFALYLENVFSFQSQPLLGPPGGAIGPDETRELVAYAARYHVTLLPEQQTFGHLHHVLKNELYSDLAELPHGHVLAPGDERAYALIGAMYEELTPLFPGPFLHLGGDETFELGLGRSQERAAKEGLGKVYLEHLRRVTQMLAPTGKKLMFWHDVARHYPDLLDILPKDAIAVVWAYEPNDSFERLIKPFRDAGFPVFVAPGANNWNAVWPNRRAALVNVRNLVRDGQRLGASGMLMTTWDDDGEALFELTWPSVVFSAGCAWQQGESSIERFEESFDWAFFRAPGHSFTEAMRELDKAYPLFAEANLGQPHDDSFWLDPFGRFAARYHQAPVALGQVRRAAETALVLVRSSRAKARANTESLNALEFASRRLDYLGLKFQLAREITGYYAQAVESAAANDRERAQFCLNQIADTNGRLQDLRDGVTVLRDGYEALWRRENRPYYLGSVLSRYDSLRGLFQRRIDEMLPIRIEFGKQLPLPAPSEVGLRPFGERPRILPAALKQ